ncbi:hypothetical protein PMEGAPR185_27260 [Priestia megaterium]
MRRKNKVDSENNKNKIKKLIKATQWKGAKEKNENTHESSSDHQIFKRYSGPSQ